MSRWYDGDDGHQIKMIKQRLAIVERKVVNMLTFNVYSEDRERDVVHINPNAVASITETERRPMDRGYQQVAIIHLLTGEKHIVYDSARSVANQLSAARSAT